MKKILNFLDPALTFRNKERHSKNTLLAEILITLVIACVCFFITTNSFISQKDYTLNDVKSEYKDTIENYIRMYKAIAIPVKEKLVDDPTFTEMQYWMVSMDKKWGKAVGTDFFDGFAFPYKGGFIHSWGIGDYSGYDPKTRPWYIQAAKANGEITVVAPYVTFLNRRFQKDDKAIIMTIAQKIDDEITFDLDIKINDIHKIAKNKKFSYKNTAVMICDKFGNILTSSNDSYLAHNIYKVDDVIHQEMNKDIQELQENLNEIFIKNIDGTYKLITATEDEFKNTIFISAPLLDVFLDNYLPIILLTLLLIFVEIYIYKRNLATIYKFFYKDKRLSALTDSTYQELVYIDIETMQFYGNTDITKNVSTIFYKDLYESMKENLSSKNNLHEFEEFLSPKNLVNDNDQHFSVEQKRFSFLKSKSKDPNDQKVIKTYDIKKISFINNKRVTVSLAMQDVSESTDTLKAALKQAKVASSAKSSFLSKMSHEIRTPLNAIIGYLNLAKEETVTKEKIEHYIANSSIAADHLLQIINDVLDISSIESGKMKIANEEFNLKDKIQEITSIFYQNAKLKEVQFNVKITDVDMEWLIGDKLRLNQIIMNLLSNSIKFTPKDGHVGLEIKKLKEVKDDVFLQFIVTDSGIGMSEEFISRIFTPFEQEDAVTSQKYGGSGLGLSITHNLVLLMGGNITVESKKDIGSTFKVTLPFGKSLKEGNRATASVNFSKIRCLIIDDNEDDASYIKTVAKHCGIKADTVTNKEDALRKIESRYETDFRYNMCMIDWRMPDTNGIELASLIKEKYKDDMPIIIATAYDTNELVDDAHDKGITKVIAKPVFQSTLMDLLVSSFGTYIDENKIETQASTVDLSKYKILIAEDNPMNMEIAVTVLNKVGAQVVKAENGQQALDIFTKSAENEFDVILMDVQMPILDGYQASTKIRASTHPQAATIPIIAVTANAFTEDVNSALASGMNDHVAKPIDVKKLYLTLQTYCKKA